MAPRTIFPGYELPRDWRKDTAGGLLNDIDEDIVRRMRKRRDAVDFIKASTTYAKARQISSKNVDELEPNPDDVTKSKRAWESALRKWRVCLRFTAGEVQIDGALNSQ